MQKILFLDHGLHIGINRKWPEIGRPMQWCEGKNQWFWTSKHHTNVAKKDLVSIDSL